MRRRPTPRVPPELIAEYRERQHVLASQVVERPLASEPHTIVAGDVHLAGDHGVGSAVAVRYPGLDLLHETLAEQDITFPYIPGLLSFREAPVLLAAIHGLAVTPDLIFVDGHGRAHPRRAGIACQVGVELGIPTIGVAKSILVGSHAPLGEARGSTAPLEAGGDVVGMAVRTRDGVSPVYVSVGNLITLADAVEWTLRTTTRYRLPEPSRLAHRLAKGAAADLG